MGLLTYNGVSLPFVKTEGISFERIMEHGSYQCTKVTVDVSCVLGPEIPGLLRVGETMQQAMRRIEHAFDYPRKQLTVTDGGQLLVKCDEGNDVKHGPTAPVFNVTQITGSDHYHCRFTIICHLAECDELTNPSKWLTHTWKEYVDIDAEFKTSRTRSGKLVLRSDLLGPKTADDYRGLVTPPIPDPTRYVRTREHFELSDDGLELSYQFVDEETYVMVPAPAVRVSGEFRVDASHFAKHYGEVTVSLTGDMKANKNALIAMAVQIAMDRLNRANISKSPYAGGRATITGSLQEDLYQPKVTVRMRSLLAARGSAGKTSGRTSLVEDVIAGTGQALVYGILGIVPNIFSGIISGSEKPGSQSKPDTPFIPSGFVQLGFGRPPLGSESGTLAPDPGLRATGGLKLAAAALRAPCTAEAVATSDLVAGAPQGITNAPKGEAVLKQGITPFLPAAGQTVSQVGLGGILGGALGGATAGGGGGGATTSSSSFNAGQTVSQVGLGGVLGGALAGVSAGGGGGGATTSSGSFNVGGVNYASTVSLSTTVVPASGQTVAQPPNATEIFLADGYLDYQIKGRWMRNRGVVSGTDQVQDGKTRFYSVNATDIRFVLEYSARRVAEKPVVPNPEPTDANMVILSDEVEVSDTELAPNGIDKVYSIFGRYEFGFKDSKLVKYGSFYTPVVAEAMGLDPVPVINSAMDGDAMIYTQPTSTELVGTTNRLPVPGS